MMVLVYVFVGIECGGCEKNDEYYGECVIVDGVFVCVVGMCDDFYFGVVCFYVFLEFVEGGFQIFGGVGNCVVEVFVVIFVKFLFDVSGVG